MAKWKASQEQKDSYIADVCIELERRQIQREDIPLVISKTGFLSAMEKYAEQQLHYSISDAVDEILVTAAVHDRSEEKTIIYTKDVLEKSIASCKKD